MIKATIKATGEQQYFFESKSQPGHYHKVTHNAQQGCYECNCLGFTGRYHKCWHVAQVAKLATADLKAAKAQPVAQQPVAVVTQEALAAQWHEANERAMAEERATSQAQAAQYSAEAEAEQVLKARWEATEPAADDDDQWGKYQLWRMSH